MRRLNLAISDELHAKALRVHSRLSEEFGCPISFPQALDPVSELVFRILSRKTKHADSNRAFDRLRKRYKNWSTVRDAPADDIEAAIAPCTRPELKAPRIQHVLMLIGERHGSLSLDFLADLPVPEARAWLERLPGVGPRTSAAVLLFSTLRRPALPVDSHHHRVAVRLGLIPNNLGVGHSHARLQAQIPPDWSAQQVYDNHKVLRIHGQNTCHRLNPDCDHCPLFDLCPYGQTRSIGPIRKNVTIAPPPEATFREGSPRQT